MQKNQFQDLQIKELKKQLEENKKAHESILKAFDPVHNDSLKLDKIDSIKLQEIREQHKKDIKNYEADIEMNKKNFQTEKESYIEKINELE